MSYAAPVIALPTPQVLGITSPWCMSNHYRVAANSAVPSSQTNNTANEALYIPFVVTTPVTFKRGFWYNSSVPGNYGNACVGIYTPDGTRQATTGAVAAGTASVIQSAAFSVNYDATPGIYYMAISFSASGINSIFGNAASAHYRMVGFYREATGVHPLPATATFATWTSQVLPFFGITTTSFAI